MRANRTILGMVISAIAMIFTLTFALIFMEVSYRIRKYPSIQYVRGSIRDPELGWDRADREKVWGDKENAIYVIGDSFSQGAPWVSQLFDLVQDRRITLHNLSVAGYGTVQEYLKLKRHLEGKMAKLVILQVFLWNDLRDNLGAPSIWYGPERYFRPTGVVENGQLKLNALPFYASFETLAIYERFFFPLQAGFANVLAKNGSLGSVLNSGLPLSLSYQDPVSWMPFYQPSQQSSPYVEKAWALMASTLNEIHRLTESSGATLLVVYLDNAFSVDKDVFERWIPLPMETDILLPATRLEAILKGQQIESINLQPLLLEKSRTQNPPAKMYDLPLGNLNGHLMDEGNKMFAEVVADKVKKRIPSSRSEGAF